jgi:hypothetical protein
MQNPQGVKQSLVRSCLKTFQTFMTWIPFAYIFDTELIPLILNHFIVPSSTRIEGIKTFGEIAALFTPQDTDSKILTNNQVNPADQPENRPNLEKLCLYFCLFI